MLSEFIDALHIDKNWGPSQNCYAYMEQKD
jgi:hypothetical protein